MSKIISDEEQEDLLKEYGFPESLDHNNIPYLLLDALTAQRDSSDRGWIKWLQEIGWEDNGLFSFPIIYWHLLKRKEA